MINWPTAFVIAIAMICGAFLINKPSDAAFGGGENSFVASSDMGEVWQSSGDKIRFCEVPDIKKISAGPKCSPYL